MKTKVITTTDPDLLEHKLNEFDEQNPTKAGERRFTQTNMAFNHKTQQMVFMATIFY